MKNLFETYMTHKKITIPVTVLVAVLAVGGIAYGVTASHKDSDNKQTTAKTEKVVVPEYICYDKAGTYSDKLTYTAGDITVSDVTVENATFATLTITESVGDGSVTLNNDTVKEVLIVNGGGTNSLHINGGTYEEIISNDYDCHIVIDEACAVNTLTVPASALIEVNGTVKTANVVPSTYDGEITWETGFKAGDSAKIDALNISEEVAESVAVEDVSGAVKEQKSLSKEQTSKVQTAAQNTTTAANNTASTAKNTTVNSGASTSASNSNNTSASNSNNTNTSNNNHTNTPSVPSNSNNTNTSSGGAYIPSMPSNGGSQTTVTTLTCSKCGLQYRSNENHSCPTMTCDLCGETYIVRVDGSTVHDCPYTTDYYGNKVLKTSRYVVAVGGWGTKKYSDGTYEVTDEGRNANRQAYESEKLIKGDDWSTYPNLVSLDAYVVSSSGV